MLVIQQVHHWILQRNSPSLRTVSLAVAKLPVGYSCALILSAMLPLFKYCNILQIFPSLVNWSNVTFHIFLTIKFKYIEWKVARWIDVHCGLFYWLSKYISMKIGILIWLNLYILEDSEVQQPGLYEVWVSTEEQSWWPSDLWPLI